MSLLDWHDCFQEIEINTPIGIKRPFIQELHLETAASFEDLVNFYHLQIGFPLIAQSDDCLSFQAGQSKLNFLKTQQKDFYPFYHFAFNIPQNKILAARDWQLKRSPLITSPSHMMDNGFPKDVRHFRNWNAHSVFFWDPAGNLVEYIARHDLNNGEDGRFSTKDILYISEIAFIVDDVNKEASQIANALQIQEYQKGSYNFRAMGDEMGLLLLMKKGRIWESQTKQAKSPNANPTNVKTSNSKYSYSLKNLPYQIN